MSTRVQDHYRSADIVERILAAADAAAEAMPISAERFFPYDQLHGRELLATRDHAKKLNPDHHAHLLDVGAGIGGPARFLASAYGCRVTGIDITDVFVTAANDLTHLCGLEKSVGFFLADAAHMPFEADTFDHAYCFYVGMNLPDKPAVLRECFRVLKPGAMLLWTEATSRTGEPHYPLPWSRSAEGSYLDGSDELTAHISSAGFDILSVEDETQAHLELARQMKADGKSPSAGQIQANEVVLGADFLERRFNYIRSMADGALASTVVFAQKP